jgi:hypothetical protein
MNRSWGLLTLCAGTIGLALVYALVGLYPFGGARLSIFLWPIMFILFGAALAWPFEINATRRFAVPLMTIALLLTLVVGARSARAAVDFNKTYHVENIKPVIDRIRGRWRSDDVLFLYAPAKPAFDYYTRGETLWNRRSLSRHREADYYLEQIRSAIATPGVRRVWVLFSHVLRIEDVYAVEAIDGTPGLNVTLLHGETGALVFRVERVAE